MKTLHTARSYKRVPGSLCKDRLIIKGFKSDEALYHFLTTGGNSMKWVINSKPDYYGVFKPELAILKPGTYAFAGGKWHNVKDLDPTVLSHI